MDKEYLQSNAFPENDANDFTGMTKIEYASIQIMAQMVASEKYNGYTRTETAELAVAAAKQLFRQLYKETKDAEK